MILSLSRTVEDGLPLSPCRVCNSTKRERYVESTREVIDGILYRWLRTRCLDCGQCRVDRITAAMAGSIK